MSRGFGSYSPSPATVNAPEPPSYAAQSGLASSITPFTSGIRSITKSLAAGFAKDPAVRSQYQLLNQRDQEQRTATAQDRIEYLMEGFGPIAEAAQREGRWTKTLDDLTRRQADLLVRNGLPEEDAAALYDQTRAYADLPAAGAEPEFHNFYNPESRENVAVDVNDPDQVAQAQATGFTVMGEAQSSDVLSPEREAQNIRQGLATRPISNTTINSNVEAPVPKDHVAIRDSGGKLLGYQVVEGSETDRDMKDAAAKAEGAKIQGKQDAKNVIAAIDSIEKNLQGATLPTTGQAGALLANIGGTAAKNIDSALKTVKANIAFDKLTAMRAASPNGSALGSITEGELDLLSSTIASLEQSQSAEQFTENLAKVRQAFDQVINGGVGATALPDAHYKIVDGKLVPE